MLNVMIPTLKRCAKAIGLLFFLSFMTATSAYSQVVSRTQIAAGEGVNRNEAIVNALVEAAGKAFGVRISSEKFSSIRRATSPAADEGMQLLEEFNHAVSASVNSPRNRPILSYDILSVSQEGVSLWKAEVGIEYAAYQELGAPSTRRTVVVAALGEYGSVKFAEKVQESLVATRRFDVLERNISEVFEKEKKFLSGADSAGGEIARLANVKGADYMFLVEIRNLVVVNQIEIIKLTGESKRHSKVSFEIRAQILETASRELKWAKTLDVSTVSYGADSSVVPHVTSEDLSHHAQMLVASMVEAIYPIRAIKGSGGQLIINRGGESVKIGDEFEVFELGIDIKDPQSGELLGREESLVATAAAVSVKPKYAVLRVRTGGDEISGKEFIVRRHVPKRKFGAPPSPATLVDLNAERNRSLLMR